MRIRAFVATVALVAAAAGTAHAKSPVQVTPDEISTTILVNKFIPETNEQWVIAMNFSDMTVTGNVFNLGGQPPTFFFCDAIESDDGDFDWDDPATLAGDTITLECKVAGGCTTLPCTSDWQPVAAIELPGSFFLP